MNIPPLLSFQDYVFPADEAKYNGGRRPVKPEGIVIHCTGGDTAESAMGWLNRKLNRGEGKASYNYLIAKRDSIFRFLDPSMIAYHAGSSSWPTIPSKWGSLNTYTIGIGFANDNGSDPNPDDDPLTGFQLDAATWLCCVMCERYDMRPWNVVGHCEIAPKRKTDPLPRILNMPEFRSRVSRELMLRKISLGG